MNAFEFLDRLKEFVAQKEFLFPPEPSMRLVTDTIEFGTRELPRWNTISISGYHIREAGSTAVQELAFTIADGLIVEIEPERFAATEAAVAATSSRTPHVSGCVGWSDVRNA